MSNVVTSFRANPHRRLDEFALLGVLAAFTVLFVAGLIIEPTHRVTIFLTGIIFPVLLAFGTSACLGAITAIDLGSDTLTLGSIRTRSKAIAKEQVAGLRIYRPGGSSDTVTIVGKNDRRYDIPLKNFAEPQKVVLALREHFAGIEAAEAARAIQTEQCFRSRGIGQVMLACTAYASVAAIVGAFSFPESLVIAIPVFGLLWYLTWSCLTGYVKVTHAGVEICERGKRQWFNFKDVSVTIEVQQSKYRQEVVIIGGQSATAVLNHRFEDFPLLRDAVASAASSILT